MVGGSARVSPTMSVVMPKTGCPAPSSGDPGRGRRFVAEPNIGSTLIELASFPVSVFQADERRPVEERHLRGGRAGEDADGREVGRGAARVEVVVVGGEEVVEADRREADRVAARRVARAAVRCGLRVVERVVANVGVRVRAKDRERITSGCGEGGGVAGAGHRNRVEVDLRRRVGRAGRADEDPGGEVARLCRWR